MKTLKLKNATLEELMNDKVYFLGELKGYQYRLSYTITDNETYEQLCKLDKDSTYNIWKYENVYRFILQK